MSNSTVAFAMPVLSGIVPTPNEILARIEKIHAESHERPNSIAFAESAEKELRYLQNCERLHLTRIFGADAAASIQRQSDHQHIAYLCNSLNG